MTTSKLAIFCAVILGTFSLIFALPHQLGYQPVGVVLNLPEFCGGWIGKPAEVLERERQVLVGSDFARKLYFDRTGDRIFVSIVLSGQDMMTGIHRPERCLQAQGWTSSESSVETIDVPGVGPIRATRLRTWKNVVPDEQPAPVQTVQSVSYYFFVGYTELAASHEQRVWLDFRDRVFHGYNQRWALVMLTSEITDGIGRGEKQTNEKVVAFIKRLMPNLLGESVRRQAAMESPQAGRLADLRATRSLASRLPMIPIFPSLPVANRFTVQGSTSPR